MISSRVPKTALPVSGTKLAGGQVYWQNALAQFCFPGYHRHGNYLGCLLHTQITGVPSGNLDL